MNKLIKNRSGLIVGIFFFIFFAFLSFQPIVSFALDTEGNSTNNNTTITLANPLGDKVNNLPSFIYMILGIVFQIGAVFAVLFLMYVGFLFVCARGDSEKL